MQISNKLKLKKKEVDDVLGGEDAWKNVDRTQGKFPVLGLLPCSWLLNCNNLHVSILFISMHSKEGLCLSVLDTKNYWILRERLLKGSREREGARSASG